MRSHWASDDTFGHLLAALMPPNRLAVEMSLRYGMRIGDVLATKTEDVRRGRWTYKEEKTGKTRRVSVCKELQARLLSQAGRVYVFEHRLDRTRHRTRQAVYKDMCRVAKTFHVKHVTPHSARKAYAVRAYHTCHDLSKVQRLLNHSSEAVTMLYAMADQIDAVSH